MPCESCETWANTPVPGTLFPVDVHGDNTRPWVERCDECMEYATDTEAARAIIAAGLGVNIGFGLPQGGLNIHPYIILQEA